MSSSLEKMELRSEEMHEILNQTPNWMFRWGNLLFLMIFLVIIALTFFIEYPDTITSQASVTTIIPPQKEYAKTSAKIANIFVADKEQVITNQPLAMLENTADFNDVRLLQSFIDSIKIQEASSTFSLEMLPILSLGEIEASYSLFESNYLQYHLYKKLSPHSNELLSSKNSLVQLNGQLLNIEAQKETNASELNFKRKELNRNKTLYEKGIISASEFEKIQLEYLQYERAFKTQSVNESQVKVLIENMRNNLTNASISSAKDEISLFKETTQSLNQLKKSIKEWENKYILKSNINGTVSFLDYWTEYQYVNEGDLVFTIIPSNNSEFVAKLKTPAENSGKIKIGQTVRISLDNYPEAEFGSLMGKVTNISLMPNDEGYYFINAYLPLQLKTTFNKEIDFKQEMSGSSEIVTEDLRLIDRIFYQFRDLFTR